MSIKDELLLPEIKKPAFIGYQQEFSSKESSKEEEYSEKCPQEILDKILEYSEEYIICDGYRGEFNISQDKHDTWLKNDSKYRELISLLPFKQKNIINKTFQRMAEALGKSDYDEKSVTKHRIISGMIGKQIDLLYRQEKEMGVFKEEAEKKRKARTSNFDGIKEEDFTDVEKLFNDK